MHSNSHQYFVVCLSARFLTSLALCTFLCQYVSLCTTKIQLIICLVNNCFFYYGLLLCGNVPSTALLPLIQKEPSEN